MSDVLSAPKSEWRLGQNGKLARAPLCHQLYTALRDAILDGTIAFDAQLPTEQQLGYFRRIANYREARDG